MGNGLYVSIFLKLPNLLTNFSNYHVNDIEKLEYAFYLTNEFTVKFQPKDQIYQNISIPVHCGIIVGNYMLCHSKQMINRYV